MDRRTFFRLGIQKASKEAARGAESHVNQRASYWIRPPYALDELEFLLACTRCGECIKACPHQVVFGLSARLGAQVAATPALDLSNKGCHLCDDWPCVTACEPGALTRPSPETDRSIGLPLFAFADIHTGDCLPYSGPECGACQGSCPVPGALVWEHEKPHIDPDHCIGCGLCREACVTEPKAVGIRSRYLADS